MQPEIHSHSYTIPAWELRTEAKKAYRDMTLTALSQRFAQIVREPHLNIREITSSDLGLSSWRTPSQPANVYTVWVNHQLNHGQLIAICGVVLLGYHPKVSRIKVSSGSHGSTILGLHDFEKLQAVLPIITKIRSIRDDTGWKESFGDLLNLKMEGYFATPYFWDAETFVHLETESAEDNDAGDRLLLNGFVAELVGKTIS